MPEMLRPFAEFRVARKSNGGLVVSHDVGDRRLIQLRYNAILHLQWLRTFLAETQLYQSPVTNIMADNQSVCGLFLSWNILNPNLACIQHGSLIVKFHIEMLRPSVSVSGHQHHG
jgi:hypothetical protein